VLFSVLIVGWSAYKIQFILHDCSHKTLFRRKILNEWVGVLSGLFVGVYFKMYRFTHMRHHRLNGEPEDPQYSDYLGEKNLSGLQYLSFILSPLIGGRFISYISREYAPLLHKTMGKTDSNAPLGKAITLQWTLAFLVTQFALASISTGFWKYPELIFVFPSGLITVSLFLSRVRTLAEHQRDRHFAAHDFSRSHIPNTFDKVLLYDANFNFHVEHHLEPQIPSRNLAKYYENFTRQFHTKETLGYAMIRTIVDIYKVGWK
jgi:fatty acid desaturase